MADVAVGEAVDDSTRRPAQRRDLPQRAGWLGSGRRREVNERARIGRPAWPRVLGAVARELKRGAAGNQPHPDLTGASLIGIECHGSSVGREGGMLLEAWKVGQSIDTHGGHAFG